MRVLYVEDHAIFAGMVVRGFLADHAVTVAPSLAAAREALAKETFDVLLVDYDLPDGKGAELVRGLRWTGDSTPVVAVSSHDEGNGLLRSAGANAVCPKLEIDRLPEVLAELGVEAGSAAALEPPTWTAEQPLEREVVHLECLGEAPSADEVEARADWAHSVSLVFADAAQAQAALEALRPALAEHAVFAASECALTVVRVLPIQRVLARADALLLALETYRRLATALARRLAGVLHVSLRSLSSGAELRRRERLPARGVVNRIWTYAFEGRELSFRSQSGLLVDVPLGFQEEFGCLDPGCVLRFLRGPLDPTEASGVVRNDPAAVEGVLKTAQVLPELRALLLDDWHQVQRALEVLEAAGALEVARGEGERLAWRVGV